VVGPWCVAQGSCAARDGRTVAPREGLQRAPEQRTPASERHHRTQHSTPARHGGARCPAQGVFKGHGWPLVSAHGRLAAAPGAGCRDPPCRLHPTLESPLPPRLVHRHGHRVGKVHASRSAAHRNAHARHIVQCRQQAVRQTRRLRPEEKRRCGRITYRVIPSVPMRGKGKNIGRSITCDVVLK